MTSLVQDPTKRTFFPKSRVLLERRPVTFESDDEDDDVAMVPVPQPPVVTSDTGMDGSEIAYVHQGRVQTTHFHLDKTELVTALQSLPGDAWTTLLDDDDRRRLTAYLPSLEGWNEMTNSDAQCVAVEALLGRENLHFGNPLETLEQRVREENTTTSATVAREAYKKQAMTRFDLEREAIRVKNENLKKIEKQDDDPTPQWKKIRLTSEFPAIHSKQPVQSSGNQPVLITEEVSIFLAIRAILSQHKLNIYEIMDKLRSEYPHQCALMEKDAPVFLTLDKYIEAALGYLSDEHVPADAQPMDWSTAVFVKFDQETKQYEWYPHNGSMDRKNLLLLEQVFRAPIPKGFLNFTNNSSGVKATRKRRERILTERARDALLASDPSFAALDTFRTSRPSLLLKRALMTQESSPLDPSDESNTGQTK